MFHRYHQTRGTVYIYHVGKTGLTITAIRKNYVNILSLSIIRVVVHCEGGGGLEMRQYPNYR